MNDTQSDAEHEEWRSRSRLSEELAGPYQSPIDININMTTVIKIPDLAWYNYELPPMKMKVTNTGHTAIVSAKWGRERPYVCEGPLSSNTYVFSQMHFHWGQDDTEGSEHTVEGKSCPMEMHVVHFKSAYLTQEAALSESDGMITIVYLFQLQSEPNPEIGIIVDSLQHIREARTSVRVKPVPLAFLSKPFEEDYYLYWGSVKTTTCEHHILWFICRQAIGISSEQVSAFRELADENNRAMMRNFRETQSNLATTVYHISPSASRQSTLLPVAETHRNSRLNSLENRSTRRRSSQDRPRSGSDQRRYSNDNEETSSRRRSSQDRPRSGSDQRRYSNDNGETSTLRRSSQDRPRSGSDQRRYSNDNGETSTLRRSSQDRPRSGSDQRRYSNDNEETSSRRRSSQDRPRSGSDQRRYSNDNEETSSRRRSSQDRPRSGSDQRRYSNDNEETSTLRRSSQDRPRSGSDQRRYSNDNEETSTLRRSSQDRPRSGSDQRRYSNDNGETSSRRRSSQDRPRSGSDQRRYSNDNGETSTLRRSSQDRPRSGSDQRRYSNDNEETSTLRRSSQDRPRSGSDQRRYSNDNGETSTLRRSSQDRPRSGSDQRRYSNDNGETVTIPELEQNMAVGENFPLDVGQNQRLVYRTDVSPVSVIKKPASFSLPPVYPPSQPFFVTYRDNNENVGTSVLNYVNSTRLSANSPKRSIDETVTRQESYYREPNRILDSNKSKSSRQSSPKHGRKSSANKVSRVPTSNADQINSDQFPPQRNFENYNNLVKQKGPTLNAEQVSYQPLSYETNTINKHSNKYNHGSTEYRRTSHDFEQKMDRDDTNHNRKASKKVSVAENATYTKR